MDHNMVLSYDITANKKGGSDEQMCLHRRPFQSPWGRIEAMYVASPDAAYPGTH